MFKWTGNSGRRDASGGGSTPGRIAASRMGDLTPAELAPIVRPPFLTYRIQDQAGDPGGPRLQGLEKAIPGNPG